MIRLTNQTGCLSLQSDPLQLKALLSVVKMAAQCQNLDKITLSSLAPVSASVVGVSHSGQPVSESSFSTEVNILTIFY